MKLYSSDLPFKDREIDGTGFKYETFAKPSTFDPSELPGGVSITYTCSFSLPDNFKDSDGQGKTVLVRIYYQNGEMVQARVKLYLHK